MKHFALFLLLFLIYNKAAQAADLYIYSASSMASVLEKITKDYQQDKIYIVSAATSALAWQIMHGARADIFITAHPSWLNKVKPLKTEVFAYNRLALASKRAAVLDFTGNFTENFARDQSSAAFEKALANKRLALGDISTPIGLYTKQALDHYRLWGSAQKFAVFGHNAQAVLTWVKRGTVAAGVVYASDLRAHRQIKEVMRFVPESHEPIIYQMALMSGAQEAEALWQFLKSEQARAALKNWGFQIKK